MGLDPKTTGVAPEAKAEVAALADEVRNRSVVVQLSHALMSGFATGPAGALSAATVEVRVCGCVSVLVRADPGARTAPPRDPAASRLLPHPPPNRHAFMR